MKGPWRLVVCIPKLGQGLVCTRDGTRTVTADQLKAGGRLLVSTSHSSVREKSMSSSITLINGKTFEAPAGVTILEAAQQAGLLLEYSCRAGRCGACRVRVLEGVTAPLSNEVALNDAERSVGMILTCVRTASTSVRLDVEDIEGLKGITAVTLPCRVQALHLLAPDVMQVVLRLPPASPLRFRAGQFIDIVGPDGIARSYSLASDPEQSGVLELHVRKVPGGHLSEYWFTRAQPNDLLRIRGPKGTTYLREISGRDVIFLATGTGIAPILAMLQELPRLGPENSPGSVALYWGARYPYDLYLDPVRYLPGLDFVPVLSRADATWGGARGHVHDVLLARTPALGRVTVYACGSEAMILSARRALFEAGLSDRQFRADAFVASG